MGKAPFERRVLASGFGFKAGDKNMSPQCSASNRIKDPKTLNPKP